MKPEAEVSGSAFSRTCNRHLAGKRVSLKFNAALQKPKSENRRERSS
jgi:hypothetical protein